ncbi:hypothetical protein DYB36_012237, partial [Aphanomyces astaci]
CPYDVDLTSWSNGQVKMKLEMTAFAKLSVEYEFELTPLDVATTDILAAKIRDLQENVKALYVIRLNSPSCARKWMKSAETWVITS